MEFDPMLMAAMRTSSSRGGGLRGWRAGSNWSDSSVILQMYPASGRATPGGRWRPLAGRAASVLEVVLDLLSFGQKDGVLADVGREICDTLEVSADKQ